MVDARNRTLRGGIKRSQGDTYRRQLVALDAQAAKKALKEAEQAEAARLSEIREAESAAENARRTTALAKADALVAEYSQRAREAEAVERPEPKYVKRERWVNVAVNGPFGVRAERRRQVYYEEETQNG